MTPSPEALRRAARALDGFLGADGTPADVVALSPVIAWLEEQADAADLRELSREAGLPVAVLRRRLRSGLTPSG